jgi:hypothetical protein
VHSHQPISERNKCESAGIYAKPYFTLDNMHTEEVTPYKERYIVICVAGVIGLVPDFGNMRGAI